MKATDKIRVLETLQESYHKEVVEQLKECLAMAKESPSVRSVVVCMEYSSKDIETYWTTCEDRAKLGSRMMLAGLRRMGMKP
ncbi:hypothetical protein LCGC14_1993570 [marine sediment metagenome]|uniref:Uncharacterized protein n=1 Tax=marine sediment metagenome TaxID=412755 RepID=A0A0F9FTC9_9ZZZZ